MLLKSLLLGYLGAVLAGLAVGVGGAIAEASPAVVAATATPVGFAAGVLGFSLAWVRPVAMRLARVRSPRAR